MLFSVLAFGFAQHTAIADKKRNIENSYLIEGLKHFKDKQYEKAIQLFQTGYDKEPKPEFLFALGQAERLSGDCVSARVYYERYIAIESLRDKQRAAAAKQLSKCEAALGSSPLDDEVDANETSTEEKIDQDANESSDSPDLNLSDTKLRARHSPWYKDLMGDALLGAGVVAGAGSIVMWRMSESAEQDALSASQYDDYSDRIGDARFKRNVSLMAAGTGALLFTAAIWRYKTRDSRIMEKAPRMSVSWKQRKAVVSFSGHF